MRIFRGVRILSLSAALLFVGCEDGTTDTNLPVPGVDPALNGAWVDGEQSGPVKVYVTELRFDKGSFEWTWDQDLQQRGVYDTKDGVLTVTIQNEYGPRSLSDYSGPYSVVGDTLTWVGLEYTKK